jgi:hypothetical protein
VDYEPPSFWEESADQAKVRIFESATTDEAPKHFEFAEGSVTPTESVTFSMETAGRLSATAKLMGMTLSDVIERATATQWYLDKNVSAGLQIVLRDSGRFRRVVSLPRPASGIRPQ